MTEALGVLVFTDDSIFEEGRLNLTTVVETAKREFGLDPRMYLHRPTRYTKMQKRFSVITQLLLSQRWKSNVPDYSVLISISYPRHQIRASTNSLYQNAKKLFQDNSFA